MLPELNGLRNFITYETSDPYILNNRPFWEIITRKSDPNNEAELYTAYTNLKTYLENLAADNLEAGCRTAEMLSAKYYG